MDPATFNFVAATVIWLLVAGSGIAVIRSGEMPMGMVIMWLAFLSLATVQFVSSATDPLDLRDDIGIDNLRWVNAFFRGITFVLLSGYLWHRLRPHV